MTTVLNTNVPTRSTTSPSTRTVCRRQLHDATLTTHHVLTVTSLHPHTGYGYFLDALDVAYKSFAPQGQIATKAGHVRSSSTRDQAIGRCWRRATMIVVGPYSA